MLGLEEIQNENTDILIDIGERQNMQEDKITFLSDVIARQEQEINGLHSRLNGMEKRQISCNLVITGIKEKKQENCVM